MYEGISKKDDHGVGIDSICDIVPIPNSLRLEDKEGYEDEKPLNDQIYLVEVKDHVNCWNSSFLPLVSHLTNEGSKKLKTIRQNIK